MGNGENGKTTQVSVCERDNNGVSARSKYHLRTSSVKNRIECERKRNEPKEPKRRNRAQPLSKYRRKNANARERTRMSDMNTGFEMLKSVLPSVDSIPVSKMTKMTTLRLAINYIAALRRTLGYDEDGEPSTRGSDEFKDDRGRSESDDLLSDAVSERSSSLSSYDTCKEDTSDSLEIKHDEDDV